MTDALKAIFDKCLQITGSFEGASYGGSAGNFDGAGLSCFILQWNLGQKTLQPLIKAMSQFNSERFLTIAGDKGRQILTVISSNSRATEQVFVNQITEGDQFVGPKGKEDRYFTGRKRLNADWKQAFSNIGLAFKDQQRQAAETYFDAATKRLQDFKMTSERSLAFLFDQCVQRGSGSLSDELQDAKDRSSMFDQFDDRQKMEFILNHDLMDISARWREDVDERRWCIMTGQGMVHGKYRDLDQEYGLTNNPVVLA